MSELRKDPIIGRWVIVAAERGKRPTDFVTVIPTRESVNCPFCEGNEGMTPKEIYAVRPEDSLANSPGWSIRVVPNKFPALRIDGKLEHESIGMFDRMSGFGAHEIIIETPHHGDLLHKRPPEKIVELLVIYQKRILALKRDSRLQYVLVFKNFGDSAGASLSHPHSQIIATPIVPKRVREEIDGSLKYYNSTLRCVYCDIINEEKETALRIVYENTSFISICPFASRFPFEIWLMPKRHTSVYSNITLEEIFELADCLGVTMKRLAQSLGEPQYNLILHTEPNRSAVTNIGDQYHWHFEIIPKLTHVAGFEWGTGFYINPMSPEIAAAYLLKADIE